MLRSGLHVAIGAAVGLGAAGCDGRISLPGDDESSVAAAPARMHRLTASQYRATVRDLFGDGITVTTELEVDTRLHGFSSVGASEMTISPLAAEQYEAAALDVAAQVFRDPERRVVLVGCEPTGIDDPCVRGFFTSFGRRAWRRPMAAEELDQLDAVVREVGASFNDPWAGVEYAAAAMLQSPHFLFRVEIGVPDPDRPGVLQLDGYEMATRLSYFLWGTTPDDALLDAAARGELTDTAGLRAQAERLAASPRMRDAIGVFFYEYFNLDRLDVLNKDIATYPQLTDTLGPAMRGELVRILDDIALGDRDYRDVFTTRTVYVNAELAAHYGVDPPPEGVEYAAVELPADDPRGGLLATAGINALYSHGNVTSPTLRGRFVRMNLLCEDIPPPPPGVVTNLDGVEANTLREKLEQHRTDPICASCHSMMDPIGFAMEHFDALGLYRDTENGFPIDATGDLDGVPFDGARELGQALSADPRIATCVARQLYRHATGHLEEEAEQELIAELGEKFAGSGHRFQELIVAVVLSDGFRLATMEDAP